MDSDPFSQFIVVPDDRPILPPVDDDVFGLKQLSSVGFRNDHQIDQDNGGLLLGPDSYHTTYECTDAFDAVALFPDARENAFFPTSYDSLLSYGNSFPPALSPDSSPASVASSPWPRTPETGLSLPDVANFTPVDTMWDIGELDEESCSTIHFVDQSGNNLEDIPSQVQDVMPEDIACTPQIIPDASLFPHMHLSNTPTFVLSSLPVPSTSPQLEAVPFEQAGCTLFPLSLPHIPQPSFGFSPANCPQGTPLSASSLSPSLSPLTTVSFFSRSPSISPNPSPFTDCSPLSPAPSSVLSSNGDEEVEGNNFISSISTGVTSVKLRVKRNADVLGDGAPWKTSRHPRVRNMDEEEWRPGAERVKRSRVVSSSEATSTSSHPPDESATSQGSEAHSDATHTICNICGQGFTRASDYARHIQNSSSHPETRKMWPCPYCDKVLGRKDALGRHIKTMHPGKQIFFSEGVPGSQLSEDQKELPVRRIGQRKRRQSRKDTHR